MKKVLCFFIYFLGGLPPLYGATQREVLEAQGYSEGDISIIFQSGFYDNLEKEKIDTRYKLSMIGHSDEEIEIAMERKFPKTTLVKNLSQKEKVFQHIVKNASHVHLLPEALILAVIRVESNFNQLAVSPKGAQGLMQLMPSTAMELSVRNSFDPAENIMGGTKYLKLLMTRFNGNIDLVLAAYNGGPTLVERNERQIPDNEGIRAYIRDVKKFYKEYN